MLSQQRPPVSTQLPPGAVGPATTVASELLPLQHAGAHCSRVPCQPCCWTTRSVHQPARGTWTSPWGSCCFPILNPYWLSSDAIPTILVLQDTGSPKTPHFIWGEPRLHTQLPQALGLGSGMGVTVAVRARGQRHCSRPASFVPFVSQPGMGRESLWCPLSWQLVTGMVGVTPHCRAS